jgi:type IV fimbrial biogenesis protein FimT
MARCRQEGFTMIELMAVILILGVLIAVGMPAMRRITQATGLQGASRQVSSTLSLARQLAITQRTNVRVVFPNSATVSANPVASNNTYTAYSVMASNQGTGATWYYVGKWEFLPVGSVFLSGSGAAGSLDNSSSLLQATMPYPYSNSTAATMAYIEFRPSGAASSSSTLHIREGFVAQGGTLSTPTSTGAVVIAVDNLVGRVGVTRQ